jgi:hypothetical protein
MGLHGVFFLVLCASIGAAPSRKYCLRGESCWPTAAELADLTAALDPKANRVIKWSGPKTNGTYPAPIPAGKDFHACSLACSMTVAKI